MRKGKKKREEDLSDKGQWVLRKAFGGPKRKAPGVKLPKWGGKKSKDKQNCKINKGEAKKEQKTFGGKLAIKQN